MTLWRRWKLLDHGVKSYREIYRPVILRQPAHRPVTEAAVSVVPRPAPREPLWATAATALAEGRLKAPPRARAVRSDSTYQMDLGEVATTAAPSSRPVPQSADRAAATAYIDAAIRRHEQRRPR